MGLDRRDFIKGSLGAASVLALVKAPLLFTWAETHPAASSPPRVIVSRGSSPTLNVRQAMAALGGIEKFVKPGDRVFLKPNSISRLSPEFAVNTNPEVVREVARLCRLAGASRIEAIAHDDDSWKRNGLGAALSAEGAACRSANDRDLYQPVKLPLGLLLRETLVIKELMAYDVFINLPVAKQSPEVDVTVGLKNYMGLNWDRQIMHARDLHQCIADLASVRRPTLTLVDATRILLNNGPYGPGSVRETQTVIATTDPVAADAYAATLFKHEPQDIRHIHYAAEMGLGELNLKRMDITTLTA